MRNIHTTDSIIIVSGLISLGVLSLVRSLVKALEYISRVNTIDTGTENGMTFQSDLTM